MRKKPWYPKHSIEVGILEFIVPLRAKMQKVVYRLERATATPYRMALYEDVVIIRDACTRIMNAVRKEYSTLKDNEV